MKDDVVFPKRSSLLHFFMVKRAGLRRDALIVFTSLILFTSLGALSQQKPPVFRTRVDLLQLDVTVLDKKGEPVRGLTAADFILFEDNRPQTIEGFTAIDLPDRVLAGPVWSNKVSPDVTTNEIDNQRIFVLVIDDALSMGLSEVMKSIDLAAVQNMKTAAAQFISRLGPRDLAAIVFTQRTRLSQNLTTNHARLAKAVQEFPPGGGGDLLPIGGRGGKGSACLGPIYSVGTMEGVVKQLSALPDRRKAIVYFGGELPWAGAPDDCTVFWRWRDVFAAAQQAHVTINPIDTMGLRLTGITGKAEVFLTVADNTGGRAVVGTNDFEPGIKQIFLQNSSYYLLAYQPTNAAEDGTFRRISLKVRDRPDVEVITRRNYWAPKTRTTDEPPPPPPPPDIAALAGILPLSKLNLRVSAAPFSIAGTDRSVVTLALGVRQRAFASRTPEQVEVLVKAFSADGDPKGTDTQTILLNVPAARADSEVTRYEVLTRIDLPKPGKYELRLSAHSDASDTRGSVYVDVDVPDFRKEKLSLSGVVLTSALPAAPIAPIRALRDVIPVIPTTERSFTPSDPVTAFLRLYQGGSDKLAPVTLKIQIQDATGKSVFEKAESIAVERFSAERSAEYQLQLPLSTLTAGDYLLTIEAAAGKALFKRDVRFQVR